jgi:opacity protein-like surface antigen
MKMKNRLTSWAFAMTLGALTFAAAPLQAQDGKLRLYAGYTFFHNSDGSLSGLRLSPEYRLNGFASLVGDFSEEKGTLATTDTTLTTFLGGLRLKKGLGSAALYVHGLAGGVRASSSVTPFKGVSISVSNTGLGLDGGGGLEFSFRGSLKLRIGGDYLRRKVDIGGGQTANENDIRVTAGFVF